MKNLIKLFGLIALAAVIGFSMAACPTGGSSGSSGSGGSGGSGKTTYTYSDAEGNYKLVITQAGRAAHKAGDTFVLTITWKDTSKGTTTSTGTVTAFIDSSFTLKSSKDEEFFVTISRSNITGMAGNIPADFNLPKKSIKITGIINWKFVKDDYLPDFINDSHAGKFYEKFYVYLLKDPLPAPVYNSDSFPIPIAAVDCKNVSQSSTPIDLTFSFWDKMTGGYFILLMPGITGGWYHGVESKMYTTDNGTTATPYSFTNSTDPITLNFSQFKRWLPWGQNFY